VDGTGSCTDSGSGSRFSRRRLERVKKNSAGWIARCPAHEDRNPSLSIAEGNDGRLLVNCHAACTVDAVVAALGLELHDLYAEGEGGGYTPRNGRQVVQVSRLASGRGRPVGGLTVEQLADATDLLTGLGCETVHYFGLPAVQIPYSDEAGEIVGARYRLVLTGDAKFRWKKGTRASTMLYGASRLDVARDAGLVVLVEGETDVWTLLHHGYPAVGLPGAGLWNEQHAARLDGIDTIYVIVEPDRSGVALVNRLRESAVRPRARLMRLPTKDASELHLLDEGGSRTAFDAAMAAAVTLEEIDDEARRTAADAEWDRCKKLATKRNILTAFAAELRARGFVGSLDTPKLIFLVLVSRILRRPVSLVLRGLSSAGKSYNVESVLPFFPGTAYFDRSGMSERALVYSEESFEHRVLYIAEADAVAGEGLGAYFLRTLISENRLVYETVEKDGDRLVTRTIEKAGPTGVILTTTRLRLNAENETRMLALTVPDDPALTRAIMKAIARRDDEVAGSEPREAWRALQKWLELGAERRVTDENGFLLTLANLVPTVAVRLRRDFALVRSLVFAHAVLHQARRERDAGGRVIATLEDYTEVRRLVGGILAEGVGATVSAEVRETVTAVQQVIACAPLGGMTVNVAQVQDELRLDRRATSRRLARAVEYGFVVNKNPGRGKTAQYAIGDPIPDDIDVLPDAELLQPGHLDNLDTGLRGTPPSPSPP
jgi:hypothetical protein